MQIANNLTIHSIVHCLTTHLIVLMGIVLALVICNDTRVLLTRSSKMFAAHVQCSGFANEVHMYIEALCSNSVNLTLKNNSALKPFDYCH